MLQLCRLLDRNSRMLLLFFVLFVGSNVLLHHFLKNGETANSIYGYLMLFIVYMGLFWYVVRKKEFSLRPYAAVLLLVGAVLMRLLFFDIQPEVLSDDLYRYVWDGKVQAAGINPYLYPPNHKKVQQLRDNVIYPKINHKQMRTIYPPVAQLLFRFGYFAGKGSLLPFRLINLFFDCLCALFLFLFMKQKKLLLLYLFCPLLIIENYVGIHIDIVGASLMMGALFFLSRDRFPAAFLFLSCSVLTKYIALVAVPIFIFVYLRKLKQQERGVGPSLIITVGNLVMLCVPMLFFLPYLDAGKHLFSQLLTYNRYWQFNSFFYKVGGLFLDEPRWLLMLLTIVLLLVIYCKQGMIAHKVFLAILVLLLLYPVLYPWYLLWILPMAIILRHYPLLLFTGLIYLSYTIVPVYRSTGVWQEKTIVLIVQYLPFYGLLLYYYLRRNGVQEKEDRTDCSGT